MNQLRAESLFNKDNNNKYYLQSFISFSILNNLNTEQPGTLL